MVDDGGEVIEIVEVLHSDYPEFGTVSDSKSALFHFRNSGKWRPTLSPPHPLNRERPMKLLHIYSAATGAGSITRELTAAIVARWQDAVPGLQVTYRDLDANPLPHLTGPILTKADAAAAEAGEQTL